MFQHKNSGKVGLRSVAGAAALACALVASPAFGWQVVPDESNLAFISVKKGHVAEVHSFDTIAGEISEDGAARITIDASSVRSGVDIRQERMRDILFQAATFTEVVIEADIDLSEFEDLAVGESATSFTSGDVSIVGESLPIDFDAIVTRTGENRVVVVPAEPIIVDASEIGLVGAIEELRELAQLESISYAAPVTFRLTLDR
ncbi:MAG: YceI family protein [Alphaproteobacteria bacterium]|nr:YceI family protein [Alphaproteobacteria bacterium]